MAEAGSDGGSPEAPQPSPVADGARRGTLWCIPTPLGDAARIEDALPAGVLERVRMLRRFVAEDARSARAFLKRCAHPDPLQTIAIAVLDEHSRADAADALAAPLAAGEDLGLLSEAGMPAVADPGATLVARAHAIGARVVPLPGPSSLLLALAASGLEGQRFAFAGYLPVDAAARVAEIRRLEQRSASERETQLAIETPYRADAMLASLVATLRPDTRLAVAADLGEPAEAIQMRTVARWRSASASTTIGRRPAVFLWLAAPAAAAARRARPVSAASAPRRPPAATAPGPRRR